MKQYIATFYTHYSAIRSCQSLSIQQITAQMAPVPRVLSTSCGTCVRYQAEEPHKELMHEDFESIYELTADQKYQRLIHNE